LVVFLLAAGFMLLGPIAGASAWQVHAKTEENKTLSLEVEPSDLIDQVKSQIQDRAGIPSCRQRLFYSGKELADGRSIGDLNIPPQATLRVFVKRLAPRLWLATPTKLKGKVWVHFRAYLDGPALKVKSVVARIDGRKVWSGRSAAGRVAHGGLTPGRHTLKLTVTDSASRFMTKTIRFTVS
jgi:ubiquitin